MWTTNNPAYPIGKLIGSQQPVGLDHLALAVYPLRLDGVEPRTLLGQKAAYDPHSLFAPFDFSVVRSEPAPDSLQTCQLALSHGSRPAVENGVGVTQKRYGSTTRSRNVLRARRWQGSDLNGGTRA